MTLPKTSHPLFEMTIPSTNKSVLFRQMLVKDEKILLMAKASGDNGDIYRAVKQVVNNCLVEVDVDKLTTFDIEYAFLKIRSSSIGNVIDLTFKDLEDEKDYNFTVDLEDVKVVFPENINPFVEVREGLQIKLRYPPSSLFEDSRAIAEDDNAYEIVAARCIDSVFDGDEVYKSDDCTEEELLDYILNLDTKSYKQIKSFISNIPTLEYKIQYKNTKGTERDFSLKTLTDFFTLR